MGNDTLTNALHTILLDVYSQPRYIQSDWARRFAVELGAAASMGLITTEIQPDTFGREWRVTIKGLEMFHEFWHSPAPPPPLQPAAQRD